LILIMPKKYYETGLSLFKSGSDEWPYMGHFIHLRMGLISYIQDRTEDALTFFKDAKSYEAPKLYEFANENAKIGIDILIDKLANGEEITPREARKGKEKPGLILLLADIAYETDERTRAEDLFLKVADSQELKPAPSQKAWAHYRLGMTYYAQFGFDDALERFLKVADNFKRVSWADEALMRAGVVLYSNQGKGKEAITCFKRVLKEHRKCNQEEKAAYFVGLVYQWTNQKKLALREYKNFLRRFPKSPYADPIREVHLDELENGIKVGRDFTKEEKEEMKRHHQEHLKKRKAKKIEKEKKKKKVGI